MQYYRSAMERQEKWPKDWTDTEAWTARLEEVHKKQWKNEDGTSKHPTRSARRGRMTARPAARYPIRSRTRGLYLRGQRVAGGIARTYTEEELMKRAVLDHGKQPCTARVGHAARGAGGAARL